MIITIVLGKIRRFLCCFPKKLRSWQDFYATAGRSGRAKYQLCYDADDIADEDESDSDALKPILNKFKEAVEKFDTMLQKCSLKCKHCEFEAKDQNGLGMHMKAKHKNLNNS